MFYVVLVVFVCDLSDYGVPGAAKIQNIMLISIGVHQKR